MAEVKKIATRESYGNGLVELGKEHDNVVVLDADLAGATKTAIFKKAFPDRHFNCGIAECNLVDVGAGLSTMGLVPFVSTFAMFAAGRAYEQVRNTIGYPHLNVKICATHGGISVGEDGASHQCCEDFALMRTIPGMTVMCPSDDVEARKMLHAAYEMDGPVYIRFGRAATPVYHAEDFPFVKSLSLSGSNDTHMVEVQAEIVENVSPEALTIFLDQLMREISNAGAVQDFRYSKSTDDSYGSFFQKFGVHYVITRGEETVEDVTVQPGETFPFTV